MPPQIFNANKLSFLKTSRFLVRALSPNDERAILLEGKALPNKREIKKICCGFLENLHIFLKELSAFLKGRTLVIFLLLIEKKINKKLKLNFFLYRYEIT